MDHVMSFKHQKTPDKLRASAVKAAKLQKFPVTKETFTAFIWTSALAFWFGGTVLVARTVHWLGLLGPIPYIVAGFTCFALYRAVRYALRTEFLQTITTALGTFKDLKHRRQRLQQVVEFCVKLETATARFAHLDQVGTWGSLTALDDGIEDLVVLRRRLWLTVRSPEAITGPMPPALADYVDYVDGLFHKTMHPKALAVSVQGFIEGVLKIDATARGKKRHSIDAAQMGYIEPCPRLDLRSNIDWVLANAWCVAGHEHLAGEHSSRGDLMDETERMECFQAAYLAWWDVVKAERSRRLSFDRVLLCAPAVLFAAPIVSYEPKDRQYPVSIGSFAVVDMADAPLEYVKRLWEASQGTRWPERMTLRRIVNAARLLAKGSRS